MQCLHVVFQTLAKVGMLGSGMLALVAQSPTMSHGSADPPPRIALSSLSSVAPILRPDHVNKNRQTLEDLAPVLRKAKRVQGEKEEAAKAAGRGHEQQAIIKYMCVTVCS